MSPTTLAHSEAPTYPGAVRVTGALTEDAMLATGTGGRMVLCLHLQPEHGLAYVATVDLGDDPTDHMHAEELLPAMRTGAVLSVAARSLALRTDHHQAVLRLVEPSAVLILPKPTSSPPAPPPPVAAATAAEA